MFVTCKEMKKRLKNKKYPLVQCINSWANGLEEIIYCIIDNNDGENNDENSDPLICIDNIQCLIKDIVKTLILLKKKGIDEHRNNTRILNAISKTWEQGSRFNLPVLIAALQLSLGTR